MGILPKIPRFPKRNPLYFKYLRYQFWAICPKTGQERRFEWSCFARTTGKLKRVSAGGNAARIECRQGCRHGRLEARSTTAAPGAPVSPSRMASMSCWSPTCLHCTHWNTGQPEKGYPKSSRGSFRSTPAGRVLGFLIVFFGASGQARPAPESCRSFDTVPRGPQARP